MPLDQFSQPVRHLVVLGMLLPSVSVMVAAFYAHRDHVRIQESFARITHGLTVEKLLHELVADALEVDSRQRGYLVTGNLHLLEPFETARSKVAKDIAGLSREVKGDRAQEQRLGTIQGLLNKKLELGRQAVELERKLEHAAAVKLVLDEERSMRMELIRTLSKEMHDAEQRRLGNEPTNLPRQTRAHAQALIALLGLNTLSIGCIVLLLRHLTRLQSLVRMCAWSRTVEYEGEWLSFESYLERRFGINITHGISPAEAEKLMTSASRESSPAATDPPA